MRQPNYALYCIKMSIPTIIAHPSNLLYSASNFEIEQQIFTTKHSYFTHYFHGMRKNTSDPIRMKMGTFLVSLYLFLACCILQLL